MISSLLLSRPLDIRQVRTRTALRAAVLELTADTPYAALSVSKIAEKANIGPATFYRHYRDKDALLADVAEDFIGELLVELTPLAVATDSRAAALSLCRFVDEHRQVCVALLTGGVKDAIFEQILERSVNYARLSGMSETTWVPGDLGPKHLVNSILMIVGWWLQQGRDLTAEDMSVVIDRLVLAPFWPAQ